MQAIVLGLVESLKAGKVEPARLVNLIVYAEVRLSKFAKNWMHLGEIGGILN